MNQSAIPAVSPALKARDHKGPSSDGDGDGAPILPVQVAHALRAEGFDASEDGTGRGTPLVPIAFHGTQDPDVSGDVTHPLGRNQGQEVAIAYGIQAGATRENPESGPDGIGVRQDGASYTIEARAEVQAVAFQERGREGGRSLEVGGDVAFALTSPNGGGRAQERNVLTPDWAVRRLTPIECHRLQGFPDDYLGQVIHRGKPPADGPQYKALGNSMAVNVMRVIGERIAMVDALAGD